LVQELSNDDWKTREAATNRLIELGPGVAFALEEKLQNVKDAEVKHRIERILLHPAVFVLYRLSKMKKASDPAEVESLYEELIKVCSRSKSHFICLVRAMHDQSQLLLHSELTLTYHGSLDESPCCGSVMTCITGSKWRLCEVVNFALMRICPQPRDFIYLYKKGSGEVPEKEHLRNIADRWDAWLADNRDYLYVDRWTSKVVSMAETRVVENASIKVDEKAMDARTAVNPVTRKPLNLAELRSMRAEEAAIEKLFHCHSAVSSEKSEKPEGK